MRHMLRHIAKERYMKRRRAKEVRKDNMRKAKLSEDESEFARHVPDSDLVHQKSSSNVKALLTSVPDSRDACALETPDFWSARRRKSAAD